MHFVRHSNAAHGMTILLNTFSLLQTMPRLPETRKAVQQTNNKDKPYLLLDYPEITCKMNQCNNLRSNVT